ncbi:MAG: hypothetical protein ABSB35_34790, partial [Bryobacteraceae bacterium]
MTPFAARPHYTTAGGGSLPRSFNHQQYPWRTSFKERDRVTIALGILANDGLVIAADRQVGITEYLKTDQGKILSTIFGDPHPGPYRLSTLTVTGSGNATYLKAAQRVLTDQPGPHATPDEFEERMRSQLAKFYLGGHLKTGHTWPLSELAAIRSIMATGLLILRDSCFTILPPLMSRLGVSPSHEV